VTAVNPTERRNRPTVRLVERRTREVRLAAEDVTFLLAHARHLIDVAPAFRRGFFRLTPRGIVGWFDTPNRRLAVAPKLPWPNVRMLLGLREGGPSAEDGVEPATGLLDALASELAARLREVTRYGLVTGYAERDDAARFLRGRLRTADHIRDLAARACPSHFPITESVLDLDTAWNRVPRVVAAGLLANPDLGPAAREELATALGPWAGLPVVPLTDDDFAAAEAEARAAHYGPLLSLCRFLNDGLATGRPDRPGTGAFLIDLGRAFEHYLRRGLTSALGSRPGWSVEAHPRFGVGPSELVPDLMLRKHGRPGVVLDAKWKASGAAPDPADLHQVLAYAAVTGARSVGLVYPGRRIARRRSTVVGSDIQVSLVRVQVTGPLAECQRSLDTLTRWLCDGRGSRRA